MSTMPGGPVAPQGREAQQESVEAAVGAPDAGSEGAEWDDAADDEAAAHDETDGTGGGTGAGAGGGAAGTGLR